MMSEFFLRNPWIRALVPLVLMGVAGLAGNVLASEISTGPEISWSAIPSKVSFYIFLLATIVLCIYQVEISKHDRTLIKGFTAKQYEAAIRNKVAEDVAKRSKKLIRDGDIEKLEQETEIFNKLYGGGK
jgi:hypothetical protein